MNTWKMQQVEEISRHYNPDHDMGEGCPVTWREERLAEAMLEMNEKVKELEIKIEALLDAVPSARKK